MIYKYFSSHSADSAEELLRKITEQFTIRASDPKSFNDPFEFKVCINLEADEETAKKRYLFDNPNKSEYDFLEWWKCLRRPYDWYVEQEARSALLRDYGVTCFSLSCENHLLWSHYANGHTGFCVGFDKSIMKSHVDVISAGTVQYEELAPVFNYFMDPHEAFIRKAIFYKSSKWEYEEEFRLLFGSSGIKCLPQEAVKEVVLGCRAPAQLRKYARTKLDVSQIKYFQMSEKLSSYSLVKTAVEKNVWTMTSHF